jgi:hypothetical protein
MKLLVLIEQVEVLKDILIKICRKASLKEFTQEEQSRCSYM